MSRSVDIVPATPERWADVVKLFGPRGACAGCWCMWPRLRSAEYRRGKSDDHRRALRALVTRGAEPGLIAYAEGEPVGWCAVGPRTSFARLARSRTLAPVDDRPVWSVVCFFVARSARRSGLTRRLLQAAVEHARRAGATIVEGYPVDAEESEPAAALWHGTLSAFETAGFKEVARRSPRRPIVRRTLHLRCDRIPRILT